MRRNPNLSNRARFGIWNRLIVIAVVLGQLLPALPVAAAAPAPDALAPAQAAGSAIVVGEVYDAATGLPLAGASARLVVAGDPSAGAVAATDADGRYRLPATAGSSVRVRITKQGYTSVERALSPAAVVADAWVSPADAFLTPLEPNAVTLVSIVGGQVVGSGRPGTSTGAGILFVPPGALAADATLRLTPVEGHALAGALPLGWSPVAAADLLPADLALLSPASLNLPIPAGLPANATLHAVRWDEASGAWIAHGTAVVPAAAGLVPIQIERLGHYALLLADTASSTPPPLPTLGSALQGVAAGTPPADLSATLDPAPRILLTGEEAQTQIRVRLASTATTLALPSGTPVQIESRETFDYLDGSRLLSGLTTRDLPVYAAFGAAATPEGRFWLAPSRSIAPHALRLGAIDLSVALESGAPGGPLAARSGGTISSGDLQLIVPRSAVLQPIPVEVTPLAAAAADGLLPNGIEALAGAQIDFFGASLGLPGVLSLPLPAGVTSADQLLLVRVQTLGDATYLDLIGPATVENGRLRAQGVRSQGRYLFVRSSLPLGFVNGSVTDELNRPLAGALVRVNSFGFVSLSNADGRYIVAGPQGTAEVVATNLATRDTFKQQVQIGPRGSFASLALSLRATGPVVIDTTPAADAVNVPLTGTVNIVFSEAIDPASVAADALLVATGTPTPTLVAGVQSLAPNGLSLAFVPTSFWASSGTYSVTVSGALRDLSGNAMGAPVVFRFDTVDVTPPEQPEPGRLSATIPEGGFSTVKGTQGTADPNGLAIVRNRRTGQRTSQIPASDGSFSILAEALLSDKLELILRDAAGNETKLPLPPFQNADGSIVVGSEGGTIAGSGDVLARIDPGALPDGTIVKVDAIEQGAMPLPPPMALSSTFPFVGGLELSLTDGMSNTVTPTIYIDLSVPAPADAEETDMVFVTRLMTVTRPASLTSGISGTVVPTVTEPIWALVDRAALVVAPDGSKRYETASPPFPGALSGGTYGFYKTTNIIHPGPNGVIDTPIHGLSDDVYAPRPTGTTTYTVIAAGPDGLLQTELGPFSADDEYQPECMSYVNMEAFFGFQVGIFSVGLPYFFPMSGATSTITGFCNQNIDLLVVAPDTGRTVYEATVVAPPGRNEIFVSPDVLSDDSTPPSVVSIQTPTRIFDPLDGIELRFSERMRQSSFDALVVEDSDGARVDGEAISTFGTTGLLFRPDSPFRMEEPYRIDFGGLKDLSGNVVDTPPVTFTRPAPQPLHELRSGEDLFAALARCSTFPDEPCYVSGQDALLVGDLLFLANGERFMYEYYRHEQIPSPLLPANEVARVAVLDVSNPAGPRLIGWHRSATDPRSLAIVRDASFPYKDEDDQEVQFTGDLMVVIGGGRAVRNINTASELEAYDITACMAVEPSQITGNCLEEPDPNRRTVLMARKHLSTAPSTVMQTNYPGVPPDYGVALELDLLHQRITLTGGQRKDTIAAYVATVPIGVEAVDIVKAWGNSNDLISTFGGPDGLYRGDYFDVAIMKNGLLAVESPTSGAERLRVFSASLFPLDTVNLPRAFRVAAAENLVFDWDGDGNTGLAEDTDDDDNDGDVDDDDHKATDEIFDLALVSGSGAGGGEIYVVDVSHLTDLEHDQPLTDPTNSTNVRIVSRIPMPGSVRGICVDTEAKVAYAAILDKGVAMVDLGHLMGVIQGRTSANGLIDANQDLVDDRILHLIVSQANPVQSVRGAPCARFKDGTLVMNWELTGPEFYGSYDLSVRTPVRIKTDHDTINNVSCPTMGFIDFLISHDAKVTVTVDGAAISVPGSSVGSQAASVLLQNYPLPAGPHSLPVPPDRVVNPGEMPFQVKAVFEESPESIEQSKPGVIVHDLVKRAAFPIGHTMIEGVDLWDGHLTHGSQDLLLPGRGPDLEFARSYSSGGSDSDSTLGAGWSHNLDVRLIKDGCGRFVVVGGEGTGNAFSDDGQPDAAKAALFSSDLIAVPADALFYPPQLGYHSTLLRDPDNLDVFEFFTKSHVRYHFAREGMLAGEVYTLRFIEDPNGNRLTFDYTAIDADPTTLDVVTDSGSRSIRLQYKQIANRKRIVEVLAEVSTDAAALNLAPNITLQYGYDSVGNLVAVTRTTPYEGYGLNDARVETYVYSNASPIDKHNLTGYTDPNGHTTAYVFFDAGMTPGADFPSFDPQFGVPRHEFVKRIEKPEGVTLAFGYILSINPNVANLRTVDDPRSHVGLTTYTLNEYGATVLVEGPLGHTLAMEWCTDATNRPADCPARDALKVAETDALGRELRYTFDDQGNIVQTTMNLANADPSLAAVYSGTLPAPVETIVTRATYDPLFNRMTSQTDALGRTTWFCLDSPSQPPANSPCSPTGGKTGNLLRQVDALGYATLYTYAPNGDILTVTDARGYTTSYTGYDPFGNAARVEQPEGAWSETIYDARSRVRETIDSFGHHTRLTYDGLDRVIKHERLDDLGDGGTNQVEETRYLPGGQVDWSRNGLGMVTQFTYDDLSRRLTMTHQAVAQADGSTRNDTTAWSYDEVGNVLTETDPNGTTQTHTYDALSRRLTTVVTGAGMGAQGKQTFAATYDLAGNARSVTDLHGFVTTVTYDGLFRVVETVLPYTHTYDDVPFSDGQARIRRRYDLVGNPVYETDANGRPTWFVYDALGRISIQTAAGPNHLPGAQSRFFYDEVGNRVRDESDLTGLVAVHTYDGLNRKRSMVQTVPFAGPGLSTAAYTVLYDYDDVENAVLVTDPRGIKMLTDYDGLDRVTRMVADHGGLKLTTEFTYDANGNVRTEKDAQGGDVDRTYLYDGLNRRIQIIYVKAEGETSAPVERFFYDGMGKVVRHINKRGIEDRAAYDALDRLLAQSIVESVSNGGALLTLIRHDYLDTPTAGRYAVRTTDANGRVTTNFYNSMGFLVEIDDPLPGPTLTFAYDAVNQRQATDKKGQYVEAEFDFLNRPTRNTEYDAGGAPQSSHSTEYLDATLQVRVTDRRGIVTTTQQDALGRVVEVRRSGPNLAADYGAYVDGNGAVLLETYEHDSEGNLLAYVDARGTRTAMVYDGGSRKTSETRAAGVTGVENTITYTYDAVGNLLTMKDGRGTHAFDEQHAYDERYRRIAATNGENETTTFAYDAEDNVVAITDALGGVTTYRYDEFNLLLSVDNAARALPNVSAAGVTIYAYDANRNPIAQQDANGSLVTFKYDALNRLTDQYQHTLPGTLALNTPRGTDPTGGALYTAAGGDEATALRWRFGYDPNNNQNSITDARGQVVDIEFDYLNRPVSKVYSNVAATLDFQLERIEATYDANSNPLTVTEYKVVGGSMISETTAFVYDAFDRVQLRTRTEPGLAPRTIEYDYDVLGNRLQVIDPDGKQTTYVYDALNRLESMTAEAGTTTFQWWPDDLPRAIIYPNNTWQNLSEDDSYDNADRLLRVASGPVGAPALPFSSQSYTYDANGNRIRQVDVQQALDGGNPFTTTYAYDPSNRLIEAAYQRSGWAAPRTIDYTLDAVGNRLTEQGTDPATGSAVERTFVYEALAHRAHATYSNVNLLTRIVDHTNAANTVEYEYDANLNQVARIKDPSGAALTSSYAFDVRDQLVRATVGGTLVRFDYDAGGSRVKKIAGTGPTADETRYLYDDASVLVEYDQTGATTAKYDYGYALVTRNVAGAPAGQGREFYLLDGLGSTVNLVDADGDPLHSYRYDAWGRALDDEGPSANPRRFTGHYRDAETGLDYFGARYYDPEVGRFISQDPYQGNPGDPPSLHRYLYANANPARYIDPTGYASVEAGSGGLMTALSNAVESPGALGQGYYSRSYKPGEMQNLKGWINDENPHRAGEVAVDKYAMTGAWAGDTARKIQMQLEEWQNQIKALESRDPSWSERVFTGAIHLAIDTAYGTADLLKAGEGLAGGLEKLDRVFGDVNGQLTFDGEALLGGAGDILGDAMRILELVPIVKGAVVGVAAVKRFAGSMLMDTLPSLSKKVGQRIRPTSLVAPAAESAVQSLARAKGFEIAVRAGDPITSMVMRVGSALGITRPKPMHLPDRGYRKSVWGLLWSKFRGKTVLYHSDADLAWVKATRDMVLKDRAGNDVFISAGQYLTDDLVMKHVVRPLNKVVPHNLRFKHGAHFSSHKMFGGGLDWDKYGAKPGHPGPVETFDGFKAKMMSIPQVEAYARQNLLWHPKWDEKKAINWSTRELGGVVAPAVGPAAAFAPINMMVGHSAHDK